MPQISFFNFSAKTLVILFACLFSSEASQKKDSPAGQNELATGELPQPVNSSKTLDSSEKPQPPQFPAIITSLSSNITLNLQSADEQEASASSTPKVVRHLGKLSGKAPRMGEKIVMQMLKMNSRRPSLLRSRILGGGKPRELRLFKTVHQGGGGPPGGEVTRYAPRSLDMGLGNLMNYNPVENFYGGNQPSLLPTSSSPNSLDHLYLPEMSVKDYMKPLDMNGLGNFGGNPGGISDMSNAMPYAEGFNYNERKGPGGAPVGGFRGNPQDRNFHGSAGPSGMISGPSGPNGGGGPPEHFNEPPRGPPPPGGEFSGSSEKNQPRHHHHQQRRNPHGGIPDGPPHSHMPPRPPHEQQRGSPSNKFPRRDEGEDGGGGRDHHHHPPHFPEGGPPELPPPPPISGNPGADALQGDEGLWNILDLANMLQNQGLTQQLSSVNGLSGVGGEPEGDGEGGPPNHFDAPSPGGGGPTNSPPGEGGDGPRGGKYSDGPNSSGENDFGNYDGPPDHHEDGSHPPNRYNSPHKGKYGKPGRPHHHFGDEGGPPGGDSSHYGEYNEGQRPGGGGGRGKPGRYNNNNNNYQEGPEGHGEGGGEDSPDGSRMHGQPPPNPYKGDNDYNNPNGSGRNHNRNNKNSGVHGPGSPGPGPPNHFDEAVPNLDGNPGNDAPGPGGEGGGGEDGGEYPGEGGPPHEGYNTRDGPYDGYNSINEYGGGGYGQQGHPTNRPHSPSSTKPPHHGGDGGGPGGDGGGFDEDGEYNSQEQFEGPSGHPHGSSSGGSDLGRGHGEFPSDEGYYGGGYD